MKRLAIISFLLSLISPSIVSGTIITNDIIDSIAENMCLLQRENGGWAKSFNGKPVNYHRKFNDAEIDLAKKQKKELDATIDNQATTSEINYLLEAYQKTNNSHYAHAAKRGIDYLLEAQYPNGGWPQYYPDNRLYRSQITFNDHAMVNVLKLLHGIAQGQYDNDIIDNVYRMKAKIAVEKGIQCILATQVVIDGQKTIWAAQYDKDTLVPATARSYELPSLATAESADILMFLMALEQPSDTVKQAIHAGVSWFHEHVIRGYTVKIISAPNQPTKKDRILVESPDSHIWARFYDLNEQKPLFAGRDGQPHQQLEKIDNERRVGYSWYGEWGEKVIRQYKKWLAKRHTP